MRNDTDSIRQAIMNDTVVIAGKVRRSVGEQIFSLMKKRGLNMNQFIELVCEVWIRYTSPDHNLTAEMEEAMTLFEHLIGWKDAVMMSDPGTQLNIDRALYFMSAEGKKGTIPKMVEKPYFGNWRQSENIVEIFEETIELLAPERYRRLRSMAVDLGARNLLELIDSFIDEHSKDAELAELREQFSDNDWSEHGRKPVDAPFKRRIHKQVDSIPDLFGSRNQPSNNTYEGDMNESD